MMKLSSMNSWQLINFRLHHVEFTWELPLSSTQCMSSYRIKDCWTLANPLAMKPMPPPGKTDVISPVTKTVNKYKTPGRWYWFHLQRICHCFNQWPFYEANSLRHSMFESSESVHKLLTLITKSSLVSITFWCISHFHAWLLKFSLEH